MSMDIPSGQRMQPRLVAGDFIDKIEPKLQPVAESPQVQPPATTFERLGEAVDDVVAAAHGARKFRVKFADAEVLEKLDAAAASETWYVTIHYIEAGQIHHFIKPSDRFPTLDAARCSAAVQEDARRRIRILQENIRQGLGSLDGDRQPIEDVDGRE